jgi:hypothetical protein
MRHFLHIAAFALISAQARAEAVIVKLDWQYQNLPAAMRVYEVKPGENPMLWLTKTTRDLSKAPVGKEITDGEIRLEKGATKRLVLVYPNPESRPLYFFATPHHAEPAEFSLGFKFKCLCIDHAYTIPPNESWYRVVELRTSRDMLGNRISLSHTLVGIDEARMKKFSMRPAAPE